MSNVYRIRKGLDLRLTGEAEKLTVDYESGSYAVKPSDFHGVFPRMLVKEGDLVKAGTPIFCDKFNENLLFVSPVAGKVSEVVRGAKRVLLEVRIEKMAEQVYETFEQGDPLGLPLDAVRQMMLKGGVWPYLRQRPYGTIANPSDTPKAIHVSCFDTAPLAPDFDYIVHGHGTEFQTGLNALSRLTGGKVHLNIRNTGGNSKVFLNSKGVEVNLFEGPHPSGNPGIQIHHVDPVNKGEVVWYLRPQEVMIIGRLFLEGRYNPTRIVALTGSGVKKPRYYKLLSGACIDGLVHAQAQEGDLRFISGNVLTGSQIEHKGYLGFYDSQLTFIPEGKYHEFLGWSAPGADKLSASGVFLSRLFPKKKFNPDTNMHGGERAFVLSGQYEKVLPMDIYPVYLLKAILAQDIDKMEQLGIYEVEEEDFALCEFVCASKIEVQSIIRQGLDIMKKEMS